VGLNTSAGSGRRWRWGPRESSSGWDRCRASPCRRPWP
jgi:hypothetical protein